MLPNDPYAIQSIHAGALGYLNKTTMLETLLCAISSVLKGEVFLNKEYAQTLPYGTPLTKSPKNDATTLSTREFEVYTLLAKGHSYNEIAKILEINPKTVSTYRVRILEKLELSNTTQLIQHAFHSLC